ncbi:TonB-dependent siderophore receptor [Methylosinus sp. H3A]|uniref:TonB-dependent siderophore receptor n=1 Tax=Methylosinus sp. H3A TaxID=2785786 RepID=UPI0018C2CF9C|nr:TonB-dependent siderophore receptor [Methylosinus sp. H3A]MBG0812519.1 TonB-dependent siderophore receptor [Methylosinus sp. H3A]
MKYSMLTRCASAGALSFTLVYPALAQEALPTIDIGSATGRAGAEATDKQAELGGRLTGYNSVGAPTSSKTNIPILKTPYAVQVVPRETMDDRQVVSVKDALLENVSSVSIGVQYYDQFNIRGLPAGGSLYRNGLRQMNTSGFETANLQAIEVLKGPAAMLFGRVEPGGLIDFVPKRPQSTPYYSIQEQAGSFGHTRTLLDATGPLTEDKTLAYRVNLSYLNKNSFRDFVNTESFFIAPTVSWRPTERFTLNVDGEFQKSSWVDDLGDLGIPAVGRRPANISISRYLGDPNLTTKYRDGQERVLFAYDWTYEFTDGWSLTNRLSYNNVDYRQAVTGGYSLDEATGNMLRSVWFVPGPNSSYPVSYRRAVATNIDLKGKFETGIFSHQTLVGFDYFDYEGKMVGHCCNDISAINIYAPVYTPSSDQLTSNFSFVDKDKWRGIYAQDQISFWDDRVHLLIGGRHDWAESSVKRNFGGEPLAYTDMGRVVVPTSANSPRVGVVLQPFPWLSVYGNYTRSYGSSNGVSSQNAHLPPQVGTQFEGGVKAELLDRRLTATFAYFDITKKNITRPVPGTPFVRPIGAANSRGVEFDLNGRINENWSIIATYSHIDAVVTSDEDASGTGGLTGKRLAAVPRNSANLWVKYEADGVWKGLGLGAGVVYVDIRPGDDANTFELPAYARVDAMASYRFKASLLPWSPDLTFQINVKNLAGTTYYEGSFDRFSVVPGAPRAFLASLRAEF